MGKDEKYKAQETTKTKLYSLAPIILEKNEKIYTEALDYALNNDDIRNIAITGIYGSGKTSIWRTYVKEKKLKNIITVSIGKYDSENKDRNFENRVEMQIINQIVAQINPEKIPRSKYGFKINKSKKIIIFENIMFYFLGVFVLFLFSNKALYKILEIYNTRNTFSLLLEFIAKLFVISFPLSYFVWQFLKKNNFKIEKITFKGTEANFNEESKDATILDKDIREIVYLLNSSKAKIVIFEDLDRYDEISVFNKLRELNYIINSYNKSNVEDVIVKFIFLVKDGLFERDERLKFFDFILPITPIASVNNSEEIISYMLGEYKESIHKKTLIKISLFLDDMRLIKNIINEYIISLNILHINDLNISCDKFFSIIVIKNIFPKEFDLLRKKEGNIYKLLSNIKIHEKAILDNLRDNQKKSLLIKEIIEILYEKGEINKIFTDKLAGLENEIYYKLLLTLISEELFDESYEYYINLMNLENENNKKYIINILSGIQQDVFLDIEYPLGIIERLEDRYYKRKNILNYNLFKYCIESEEHLDKAEKILETVVSYNQILDISQVLEQLEIKTIKRTIEFLLGINNIFFKNLIKNSKVEKNGTLYVRLLLGLYLQEEVSTKLDNIYAKEISDESEVISMVDKENWNIFTSNLKDLKIKFKELKLDNVETYKVEFIEKNRVHELTYKNVFILARLLIGDDVKYSNLLNQIMENKKIEETKKYILENFEEFIENYIDNNIEKQIYQNTESIVIDILNSNIEEEQKIKYLELNDVEITSLELLERLGRTEAIYNKLFETNKVLFNKENLLFYGNEYREYPVEFISYIEKNISKENYKEVLEDNRKLCNNLLKIESLSDELFNMIIKFADEEVKNIDEKHSIILYEKGLLKLDRMIVKYYLENKFNKLLKLIVKDDKNDAFIIGAMNEIGKENLNEEILYLLINNVNSNSLKEEVVDILRDDIIIEKIESLKDNIIKYIMEKYLSDINISYICKNFENFEFKKEFILELEKQDKISVSNIKPYFVSFSLELGEISIDTKIELICKAIKALYSPEVIKKYIEKVDEIKGLSEVWQNKRPKFEGDVYKEKIAFCLIENDYVKKFGERIAIK